MTETDHDVIVVGAAMVGCTVALALANAGYRVALLDRRALSTLPVPASTPVIGTTAVSAGALNVLDALGTNHEIRETSQPIFRVHISQQGYFGTTRIDADDIGVPALGYVVDNAAYLARISRQLEQSSNLTMVTPAELQSLQQTPEQVLVKTAKGTYRSRLLLAVDGAHSVVRNLCDIGCAITDYEQTAVMTTVATELDHGGTAYERFTPSGPLALLPLPDGRASLIMTVSTAQADSLCALSDKDFLDRVQRNFGYRLGRFVECGQRQSVPLQLQQASDQRNARVLLLGNAARLLHPVAGQGFNLAVRDIGKLLELLIDARSVEASVDSVDSLSNESVESTSPLTDLPDPGVDAILSAFETSRSADQRTTVRLTDSFARGFLGGNSAISHLRGLGLIGLDNLPWLRRGLARRAMGLTAGLPDLHLLRRC